MSRDGSIKTPPSLLILLSDGIRGHLSQSRGVAGWISRFTGADIVEMEVPRLSGWRRAFFLKWRARFLPFLPPERTALWLDRAGGSQLLSESRSALARRGLSGEQVLFLSAGSSAAPFTLALARTLGGKSCTIMTPSVLGTTPFDFAVVPEHDAPRKDANVLVTLGAPNGIFPDELERRGWELAQKYPTRSGKRERWSILVGGDDANYAISPRWIRSRILPLVKAAEDRRADLYITTSRRTSPSAEEALKKLIGQNPSVRMLLLASKDSFNPVPGMLGLSGRVFVTEDSVSMVSEAVTAGKEVFLLRTETAKALRLRMQEYTEALVDRGVLPSRFLWGKPRFDRLFAGLQEQGFLKEMNCDNLTDRIGTLSLSQNGSTSLNEARRAAEWIVERWNERKLRKI
ncbi:MAG: ELM1/GtrOC1 family putative glycosyltransferase [Synergistaceae bacterium]|nr:ELM1/GtrOC1 family putative glycosyltransferase [Synergistaceae bacterium]